jgi:hypothetical protein
LAVTPVVSGQERRYDFSFSGTPVGMVIAEIERESGARFSYATSLLARFPAVTVRFAGATLEEVLDGIFVARGVFYKLQDDYVILARHRRAITVSGTVRDARSGETLIGATVHDPSSRVGTVTNEHGFYSLSLPAGDARIVFSFVGYTPVEVALSPARDTLLCVALEPSIRLEGVTVVGDGGAWMTGMQPGQSRFPIKVVNNLPALLGEGDVLKTLQLLPGVKTSNEGLAGLYVRGGNADENLYLMDGVPVYNPSHLMGFFSTFNPNVVKRVDLYKGSFPARYGGRLSSVVDVRLKEGNMQEVHGHASVGLLASKIDAEGPLERGKSSFLFSARRTYMDAFLPSLLRSYTREDNGAGSLNYSTGRYHFTDVNGKVTRKFRDGRDQLSLGVYHGQDRVFYANRDRVESRREKDNYTNLATEDREWRWGWGNLIASLEYGTRVHERLYGRASLSYNRYVSTIRTLVASTTSTLLAGEKIPLTSSATSGVYRSGIEDVTARAEFERTGTRGSLARLGGEVVYHTFTPEVSNFARASSETRQDIAGQRVAMRNRVHGGEATLFAEGDFRAGDRLRVFPGARVTLFRGEKSYFSVEPRLALHYEAGERVALKTSYAAMSQYIHLLAFGGVNLPSDLWVPVTRRVRPMRSRQVTGGVYYRPAPGWEASAEGYYKRSDNLIECVDGATVLPAYRDWEANVAIGKGESRGLELQVQRQQGRTTGWVNYTLAWAERWFPGGEINQGRRYPARGDSRHGVNAVVMHRFGRSVDASVTWVYHSGSRATIVLEVYDRPNVPGAAENESGGPPISHVSHRNNYQLPDYHRLDAGINFHRHRRRSTSTWNVSVYNVYSRLNPFFVYMDSDEAGRGMVRQASLFPVIPSVSYSITF